MFKTRSQSTPSDGLSTVAQPPSPQLVPPTADEATPLPVNEDLDDTHHSRSGFHNLISDHHSGPVEDDVLFDYNLHVGKLSLVELFNFENVHWAMLY